MSRRRTAARLVLVAVVASACGGPSGVAAPDATPAPPGTASPAGEPSASAPASAPTAPEARAGGNLAALDFVAPDLGGGQVRGADHAGKDVVLWMWAPW